MEHDLVVFVPGILGSRLTRDGRDLWHQSKQAALQMLRPSKAAERLALPPGIGDNEPEESWAVDVRAMLDRSPDHHPQGGLRPGQYVPFAYDWRLSNRLNARRLRVRVESALGQWRERAAGFYPQAHDDVPKVVFMCHSMGGLITRYYLECLGGRDIARSTSSEGRSGTNPSVSGRHRFPPSAMAALYTGSSCAGRPCGRRRGSTPRWWTWPARFRPWRSCCRCTRRPWPTEETGGAR
jgi:hypothetical protein